MRACALFDPGFSNRNSPFLIRQTFTTLTMWLERTSISLEARGQFG